MNKFLMDTAVNPCWMPIFRIGTGLVLLASFLCLEADFHRLYSRDGLVDTALLQLQQQGSGLSIQKLQDYLMNVFGWLPEHSFRLIPFMYMGLCLLLTAGLCSRLTAFLLLLLHSSLFTSLPQFSYGFDYFGSSALFYCCLFPAGRYASMDARLFRQAKAPWISPWLRLIQCHLCLVYFFAGLDKLLGPAWRNGEALWRAMTQPAFAGPLQHDLTGLANYHWIWVAAGWLVIVFELGYALFIWLSPTRRLWLWAIIALHTGIALLMGLFFFAAIMILLNLCAFYYPYTSNQTKTYTAYTDQT